ncbi:glycosyltransferase [Paraclostridium sordellii]|uniref:glycosyltransferase n=1 Tax=Paraclostridium sordellii TaxID=1505 RepID=UPI0005431E39|nr:glycosyltransferase [Paeniclostridium sordellii]MCH1967190.1 glycosyltransferase [Paeniclostridium sordellii]CEK32856.1 glycosyltransferase,GDP-mannose-dependent alpha-(1-6)-phosphatidylinositol monomannoside mannosyltransferase,putative glycosyl transferase,Glycogen synthase,colanic acid biosynthesis glycosyltransferase WcaC,Glycosyl transferases group 1 [[Clostridium] sordellii] [Paeniclostridium sordellii]
MKVLQINSVCGVGSTGRIATDLYKVLEEQGHECKIAYGRGTAPEGIDSIKIGSNFDNYMHVFKTRVFDKHGFGSVNATKKFIDKVKKYDPDIIHLHNIHGYYINIEILFDYLEQANKPVVWTLHDCWAFTGHCSHFDYIGCNKWKTGCYDCNQKEEYPSSKVIDNSTLNYEKKKKLFTSIKNMTIVTPSKWLANLVKKSFLNKYKVKVINNGVDLDVFKPTKSNFRENYNLNDKFIILGVASTWSKRKGLDYFIKLEAVLGKEYKIILVGLNDKQIKELPKNIISINKTNNTKELAEIYTTADVFINPTLEDNFPTTNLEAIACGTPIITFDTGGSRETLNDGCGIVIEKGCIKSLKSNIDYLYLNKDKNTEINMFHESRENYSKIKMFKQYINMYRVKFDI